ncbi:unnamed protein product [Clavelina lepadiformis]|uniref:Uncharacterized protein n=1 Tax=Clavelina lepadiformis TaxID=159417 RepID=A0ABP0H5C5_CLALP
MGFILTKKTVQFVLKDIPPLYSGADTICQVILESEPCVFTCLLQLAMLYFSQAVYFLDLLRLDEFSILGS